MNFRIVILVVSCFFLISCVATGYEPTKIDSPAWVVKEFTESMYRGDIESAMSYADISKAEAGAVRDILQKSILEMKSIGKLEFYRVVSTNYSSDRSAAIVETQSDIPSLGKRFGGETALRRVDGAWKVVLQ